MTVQIDTCAPKKNRIYTGYTLTILSILFMLMDASIKFTSSPQVAATMTQLGFPMRLTQAIGTLALTCTLVYALPATAVLGAILLTGYMGGAIALHLRVDNPLFTHILFPVYVAVFIWGGIWLRDRRLQEVFPVTRRLGAGGSPKRLIVTGYILTTISALLVLLTAVVKFTFVSKPGSPPPIFPMHHIHLLGYIEIVCTALYLFPGTSFLGALLLTAYMGGAAAVNLQSGQAVLPSLVPVLFSALAWAGLWLRDSRLRRILPLRPAQAT